MERELWKTISHEVTAVDRKFSGQNYTHSIGRIVRVYLWAVLHDRPVSWACKRKNWAGVRPPVKLPHQSRMSRRLKQSDTVEFFDELSHRLMSCGEPGLLKLIDGKPLAVSHHSQDPDATFGRGAGSMKKGYKLHAITNNKRELLIWEVHPMNVHEAVVARKMVASLRGEGYLLADGNYEHNRLHEVARTHGHQLLAPRRKPYTGLGNRRHSKHRIRSIDMLEGPSQFGRSVYKNRRKIETYFGNLCSFGGGLTHLPPWVRTLPRVRLYVHAKVLIRAVKNRICSKGAA